MYMRENVLQKKQPAKPFTVLRAERIYSVLLGRLKSSMTKFFHILILMCLNVNCFSLKFIMFL